jgi:transcriptional regulator with XRE-family HTH domain
MARTKWTQDYFRKALRRERERRDLTQEQLADVFKTNGLDMHWSTIAKIESGRRSVRIDEAARIADVFETSVDAMLGRATQADAGDPVARELETLVYTTHKAQAEILAVRASLIEAALSMRVTANWQPQGGAADLVEACEQASQQILTHADQVLSAAVATAERDLAK